MYQANRIGSGPKWPMSAYSASPPVTQSTTDPNIKKPGQLCAMKKRAPYSGLMAPSTCGLRAIHGSPMPTNVTNQTSMVGPKMRPTLAVPRFCAEKSRSSTTTVSGKMNWCSLSVVSSSPSIAESTLSAGVIMPSP